MRLVRHVKKWMKSCSWLLNTIYEAFTGKITVKYAQIKIWSQISLVGKRFVDGVNWNSYSRHYLEELKIIEKAHTLLIKNQEIVFVNGRLEKKDWNTKPLLISHFLLYETILRLAPKNVLEVGCGAGDHLANLQSLQIGLDCFGVDLLHEQIKLLNHRHPKNEFHTQVADVTKPGCKLPSVDLVFTHAVLMHISEKGGRLQQTLENIFLTAQKHVVFMENWTQHNFLSNILQVIGEKSEWKLYFATSDSQQNSRILIASKAVLIGVNLLEDYNDLLLGQPIVFH